MTVLLLAGCENDSTEQDHQNEIIDNRIDLSEANTLWVEVDGIRIYLGITISEMLENFEIVEYHTGVANHEGYDSIMFRPLNHDGEERNIFFVRTLEFEAGTPLENRVIFQVRFNSFSHYLEVITHDIQLFNSTIDEVEQIFLTERHEDSRGYEFLRQSCSTVSDEDLCIGQANFHFSNIDDTLSEFSLEQVVFEIN